MEKTTLQATARTAKGTRAAFNARREGRLPGVVYGEGKPSQLIFISTTEFGDALRHHMRVLDLEVEGTHEKVLIQDIQWNALGDSLDHVDFLRITHQSTVEVSVEIEFIGHPKGLSQGGEFTKALPDLQIRCAPESIPASIKLLVADLELDMSVHVKDLELPPGVEALHEPEDLVCSVQTRTAAPEEEGEEAAEGEESTEPEVISKGKAEEEEPEEG